MASNPQPRTLWPIDGPDHDDISPDAIYQNGIIRDFLASERKTILVASKGMGKTLLLRVKKKILEDAKRGQILIPRGRSYDYPQLHGDIPKSYTGFTLPEFWSELWRAAILFSTLTHGFDNLISNAPERKNEDSFRRDLQNFLRKLPVSTRFATDFLDDVSLRSQLAPSHYVGELLSSGINAVEKLRRVGHLIATMTTQFIHTPVCVFIDAFDQTITDHFSANLEVWKSGQIGLMLASHTLNTDNNHIKAYISIRQEAFAGYLGHHREAIRGKAILLDYSHSDMHAMFNNGVRRYSPFFNIEEFLGMQIIHNNVYNEDEDPFDYIYRHSSGTARSLMFFGNALSSLNPSGLPDEIRSEEVKKKINVIAGENIVSDYLKGQRSIFLKALCDERAISEFLRLIPSNVLNYRAMRAINKEFAAVRGISPSDSHPFCELFNIGLLGTHHGDAASFKLAQYFKRPHEFEWQQAEIITDGNVYFLHPALHEQLVNLNTHYRLNKKILIGNGHKWPFQNGAVELFPLVFLSHSSRDKEQVNKILPMFGHYLSLLCPHNIWYDENDIHGGDDIHKAIESGVDRSEIVLIFLSKNSLTSGWVEKEWRSKHQKEIVSGKIQVVAVIIDDTDHTAVPPFLASKRINVIRPVEGDFTESAVRQLANDVWHALDAQALS